MVTLSPASLAVGQVGTATASVRDSSGNTLGGRSLSWSSSATGVATVSGDGVVTAVASGSAVVTAVSEGVPGSATAYVHLAGTVPTRMTAVSAVQQTGAPASSVVQAPAVEVLDASGTPVPGVPVLFTVTAGGGAVSGGSATTDGSGLASAGGRTFGPAGVQSLRATSPALSGIAVDFTGTSRPASAAFDVTLRFLTPMTPVQARAFVNAKERIQEIVTGDIPSQAVNVGPSATCGGVAISETVDDILILAEVGPKDGPGGVLAEAGPCWIWNRTSGSFIVGHMLFDIADIDALEQNGTLETVILHEMLHVLGFGTLWQKRGLVVGAGLVDPYFQGVHARDMMATRNDGAVYTGTPVPVEATGGAGTRDVHWRETVFDHELMTGWVDANSNPLSATTIGSLQDLGYGVDVSRADPFDLAHPAALRGIDLPPAAPAVFLGSDVRREPPMFLDADGRPLAR